MIIDNLIFITFSIFAQLVVFLLTGNPFLTPLGGLLIFPVLRDLNLIEFHKPKVLVRSFFLSVMIATTLLVIFQVSEIVAIVYEIVYGGVLSFLFYWAVKKKCSTQITSLTDEVANTPLTIWPASGFGRALVVLYVVSLVGGLFHAFGSKLLTSPVPLIGLIFIFLVKEWGKKEKIFALGLWLIISFLGIATLMKLSI